MPYQTAIFDLDGTLLNTLDDLYNAVNHSLVAYGLPKRSLAEVRLFTGNGIRRLIDLSVPEGTPSHLTDQVFDEFKTYYDAHKLDTTRPYTGMAEVIDDLRAAGVACAVVSNKADFAVQGIIDHFYPGKFDYVMGERAGIRRKPNRDMIDVILRDLGRSTRLRGRHRDGQELRLPVPILLVGLPRQGVARGARCDHHCGHARPA